MTKSVVALYDDFTQANQAVRKLADNGFSREDISIMASDAKGDYTRYLEEKQDLANEPTGMASEGAGVGAGIGAVIGGLGGLLIGLGVLVIPGIGPVLAAGPLAAALTGLAGAGVGAVAGGVAGGLLGALVDIGVPQETAGYYVEGVRRGGTLVTVRVEDNQVAQVVEILNSYAPVDVSDRVSQWRQAGWTGYQQDASMGTDTDLTGVRTREPEPETRSTTVGETPGATDADFTTYSERFRHHYDMNFASDDYTYDQYLPAYRYGYDLAINDRYRNADWEQVESDAQRYWDERNPGTWARFKDAIHEAWLEVNRMAR